MPRIEFDTAEELRIHLPEAYYDLSMHHFSEAVYDEDAKRLGVIYYDTDPVNPREFYDSQLTRIFVPRSGPVRGDTDDIDELYELLGRKGCDIDWDGWQPARPQDLVAVCKQYGVDLRPLYAYIHSGIALSLSPFSCKWDSGQCGWVWLDLDDPEVKSVAKQVDGIDSIFRSEVQEFHHYVSGEAYGIGVYQIGEDGHPDLMNCEEVWGFFGLDHTREELETMMEDD